MSVYYKATRPDGTDFYSGTVDYADALATGRWLRVRTPARDRYAVCTSDVLHASDTPTETLIGGSWPCRLFEVTGRPVAQVGRKYGFRSLTVVREVDAHLALGPQGVQVAALIERAGSLTADEVDRLAAARAAAAGAAAWAAAAGGAARAAAGAAAARAAAARAAAAGGAARAAAARAAARTLVVRDLIDPIHYDTLTRPWRDTIGPIHPEDPA